MEKEPRKISRREILTKGAIGVTAIGGGLITGIGIREILSPEKPSTENKNNNIQKDASPEAEATPEEPTWGPNLVENGSLENILFTLKNVTRNKTYHIPAGFALTQSNLEHGNLIKDPNGNYLFVEEYKTPENLIETSIWDTAQYIPVNENSRYRLTVSAMFPQRGVQPDFTSPDVSIWFFDNNVQQLNPVRSLEDTFESPGQWQKFELIADKLPGGASSAILRFSILGGKIEEGKENPKIFYKNISFQEEITPNSTPLIDEGSA